MTAGLLPFHSGWGTVTSRGLALPGSGSVDRGDATCAWGAEQEAPCVGAHAQEAPLLVVPDDWPHQCGKPGDSLWGCGLSRALQGMGQALACRHLSLL